MGCLLHSKNILLHILLTLKSYIMPETNCTCNETEYLCTACYQEYCKQEAEYYEDLYYRESIAHIDIEELPC